MSQSEWSLGMTVSYHCRPFPGRAMHGLLCFCVMEVPLSPVRDLDPSLSQTLAWRLLCCHSPSSGPELAQTASTKRYGRQAPTAEDPQGRQRCDLGSAVSSWLPAPGSTLHAPGAMCQACWILFLAMMAHCVYPLCIHIAKYCQ